MEKTVLEVITDIANKHGLKFRDIYTRNNDDKLYYVCWFQSLNNKWKSIWTHCPNDICTTPHSYIESLFESQNFITTELKNTSMKVNNLIKL